MNHSFEQKERVESSSFHANFFNESKRCGGEKQPFTQIRPAHSEIRSDLDECAGDLEYYERRMKGDVVLCQLSPISRHERVEPEKNPSMNSPD
jgi:hypothetical protein